MKMTPGFVAPPKASVKRLSSIVLEVQTTIAFQLHLQVMASLFCGMGPKVPAERLRQSLYTLRRIRRHAVGRRESRTPKLRTEGRAPAVLKCFTTLPNRREGEEIALPGESDPFGTHLSVSTERILSNLTNSNVTFRKNYAIDSVLVISKSYSSRCCSQDSFWIVEEFAVFVLTHLMCYEFPNRIPICSVETKKS